MTRGRPNRSHTPDPSFWKRWNDELCAEHNGEIASFRKLSCRLEDIGDYKKLFKREKVNLLRTGKIVGGMVCGCAVFGPLAYVAAPSIASALGGAGALGAASTGTTISTLSGVALTNASVAAIGGGTMATGMAAMTAVGAGLGAVQGGVISNNYFGQVKDFRIKKIREGKGPALIYINGFLSQKQQNTRDWDRAVGSTFRKNPCYLVTWEAKNLYALGSMVAKDATGKVFLEFLKKVAKRTSRKAASKLNPLTWV